MTISNQSNGNQVYEIKPSLYNGQTNNYKKYVDFLDLNEKQKQEVDSILNSYKKDIYVSVLMNDKNTVAVSSKIGELQKAVLANLVSFAQDVSIEKSRELFQSGYSKADNKNLTEFITAARERPQSEYVFITPDTAFKTTCTLNTKELESEIDKKIKIVEAVKSVPPIASKNWNVDFQFKRENNINDKTGEKETSALVHVFKPDSHFFKVVIPIPEIVNDPKINDSVSVHLKMTADKLRNLSINLSKKSKDIDEKIRTNLDQKTKQKQIELFFQDPTEIVGKTMELLSKKNFKDWDEFGQKMDSIAKQFAKSYADSVMKKNKISVDANKGKNRNGSKIKDLPKDTSTDIY